MSRKVENLRRALGFLERCLIEPIRTERDLGGVVKAYECAYELAWTTLKMHLASQGHVTQGAKDVFRTAWQLGVLTAEENVWLAMIADRNLTVHVYDMAFSKALVERVRTSYLDAFRSLTQWLEGNSA